MEGPTPQSQTEEVKASTIRKDNNLTGAGAVIVRMPDSNHQQGLRAWVDRREVDEMVTREERGRSRKHSFVQIVRYVEEPEKVRLKEGMELYFVGHGSSSGFIGNRIGGSKVAYIGENDLREWIRQRRDRDEVIRLEKIKLVTCNSAKPGSDGIFAERLAAALKGIVTGRVVGFSQYLLSAPKVKATYATEPPSAWVSTDLEDTLRLVFAEFFADLLLTTDKKYLSTTAVQWARQVLCHNPANLNSLAEMYIPANKPKRPVVKKILAQGLKDREKHWIAWPKKDVEDLEAMIAAMEIRNTAAVQPTEVGDAKKASVDATEKNWAQCKSDAQQVFTKMRDYILKWAKEEWSNRKRKLIAAFDKKETPSERKTPGNRLTSRQEFIIPS